MPSAIRTGLCLALLSIAAIAGCTTKDAPSSGSPTEGAQNGSNTGGPGFPGVTNATALAIHNVTVDIPFSSPGAQGPGAGADVPSGPMDCNAGAHEAIVFDDATLFNGTMIDHGTSCDSMNQHTVAGYWLFTGSIVGCTGSGTATIPWYLKMDSNPVLVNPNGEVLHGHDILSTPTNSTGFAGITELKIDADYGASPVGITAHGTLKGYILCK